MAQRILWRLLPDVRRHERPRFVFFLLLLFLLMVADAIGLVAAESLFLARVGIEHLPAAFVAASIVAALGSLGYAALVGARRNDRLFVALLLVAAAALLVAGWGASRSAAWAFVALVCLYWLNRAVFANCHYWTFAGDHFDAVSSKRLFPLFGIGSSVGGMLGGVLAAGLVGLVGAEWLIAAWAGFLLAAAALLVGYSGQLLRWIPLEQMEADDTSVEGMHSAARYLRASPLGRWLVASSLGMVVALFVAQFVYSDVFARAFPRADDLALFFGVFLACANLVEIAVETGVSRWLIPRFGVPTANLLHPLLTLASFAGLASAPRLPMAVVARLNRETFENALAIPVRHLTYHALPHRYRIRVRGFLEGMVVNLGMAAAGLVLLLLGPSTPLAWVCALGGAASLVYAGANLGVQREYLRALMTELRSGRLDLRELEGEIGSREATYLAQFWDSLVAHTARPAPRTVNRMARMMAHHGLTAPLLRGLAHPHAPVRRASLEALVEASPDDLAAALEMALADPDPLIRVHALQSLAARADRAPDGAVASRLRECVAHPDPDVRAHAAALLGGDGLAMLEGMLEGDAPDAAAALTALPEARIDLALDRILDPMPAVRAAALGRLARAGAGPDLDAERIGPSLRHPDAQVRVAALRVLATQPDRHGAEAFGERLGDPSREVRRFAVGALVRLGEAGSPWARRSLASDSAAEVTAGLEVLAGIGSPEAIAVLRAEFRQRVRRAWGAVLALRQIPETGPGTLAFLRLSFEDAFRQNVDFGFAILERLEEPGVLRVLQKTLRFSSSRVRADALEVLSHLGDREGSRLLVALLEEGPLEERSALAASLLGPWRDLSDVLQESGSFGRWVRAAAAAHLAGTVDAAEVPMERLLLLRRVPLFGHMTLEQLEAIDELMNEVQYLDGEIVFREGDAGDELFVLLEGQVEIVKQAGTPAERPLSTLIPGSYFGEMAILSDEPRSATAKVSRPARLLSLRGERLKELLLEMPEISFEIFRVLTTRIRVAEDRLERRDAEAGAEPDSLPRTPS